MQKYRADELLPRLGLCNSRSAAQEIIKNGQAALPGGLAVRKPSQMLAEDCGVTVCGAGSYVSRGAGKWRAAIDAFHPDISGKIALDLGASTGGFTDVLLTYGASKVFAVDVGTGQLHEKLRADPRVVSLEQTNARDLSRELIREPVEVLTGDLCFISLTKALPACVPLLAPSFWAILLVKPQFEAERRDIGSGGVVRSPEVRQACLDKIVSFCVKELGWRAAGSVPSPVIGPKGNQEYLAAFTAG